VTIYFPSWDTIERRISPIGKLKMFNEMKEMGIKYEEAPFNTVHKLMKWRNKVAHGRTEIKQTSHTVSLYNYEDLFYKIEPADWRKYVIDVDIKEIEKDCKGLMDPFCLEESLAFFTVQQSTVSVYRQ
jgi:hypothetical protein